MLKVPISLRTFPKARDESKRLGLSTYLGEPCSYGHFGERYHNGACVRCKKIRKYNKAQKSITRQKIEELKFKHELKGINDEYQ